MSEAVAAPRRGSERGVGSPIFEVEAVFKRFGGIRAVNGARISVPAGLDHGADRAERRRQDHASSTSSPASTSADSGAISFDGQSIFGHPPYAIARLGMVRTFQITKALAAMPVIDNMTLAAPASRARGCAR